MRKPSCPRCQHDQFEPEAYKAQESGVELTLVQCVRCGTVVEVDFNPQRDFEWEVLIRRMEEIEKILKEMQTSF